MARYNIGWTKTTTAAAGGIVALRGSSTRDIRIFELGIFSSTAVAGEVGLIRPTAAGTASTSTAVGAALDSASAAGLATVDLAWSSAPTIGTNYMRRIQFPATIGAGVIWTFPLGINVPVSGSLALWQISAAAVTFDGYFDYDE